MPKVFWFSCFLVAVIVAGWFVLYQTDYFTPGGTLSAAMPGSVAATDAKILTPEEQSTMSATMAAVVTEPAPALGDEYRNTRHRFSVQMPVGFSARELDIDENGGEAIVLQNASGEGVQIYITPNDSGLTSLSADDIRASLPDMRVVDAQDVELGTEKGVAFMSDNEAYGGASREVWFYFGGKLYQVSTYARLDPLLKAMFGTWKFF